MILYIHIPFCTSRCGYCTFNSFENKHALIPAYINALCTDLASHSTSQRLDSIFFGGGTPNTLDPRAFEKIFATLHRHFSLAPKCEITLESNPDLVTKQWCKDLHTLGANRLSFGVQSFFADKLAFLQREHSQRDIHHALECATRAGFQNLSIDLIYDTPLDNEKRIKEETSLASALPINHLSAYSLTIEKQSRLQKQGVQEAKESLFDCIRQNLAKHNFTQYETSNYARGYKVAHNLAYWRNEDYIGCGCGAVGKRGDVRSYTHQNLEAYIADPTYRKKERLSKEDKVLETLFLGLRSEVGVSLEVFQIQKTSTQNIEQKISWLLEEEKCYIQDHKLFAKDYFLADEIALFLS
ncbi:radical SAM family heme chaperone HemW [Helicobacter mustelae]|uniref:Heme chaperone HemW n=1 Tax=Helicobacter mustelae (strain ATCC 43772 / CCUG 25715 / CIP 103759 / LMG 18044 / NCTC 12198 / R85-136P) TaxID=679897 RepID=D3UFY3_HELM1|nr:radical SAM family heme chaperone HemW [Helicobacter mustelae]CBG39404.1 putative oxygen-independent coproporhyrinogen III oxidase; HemN [Helicobacter mustelae 12198]SQH70917.1 oxygen-independent coproporhyrinogen III oxidase HemN [Helicobacter mustelae]